MKTNNKNKFINNFIKNATEPLFTTTESRASLQSFSFRVFGAHESKIITNPNNIFLTNKKNTSPIKEHVKEYSEILDLEKRNMRVFNLYYVFFLLFLLKDSNVTTLAKFFRNLS